MLAAIVVTTWLIPAIAWVAGSLFPQTSRQRIALVLVARS